MIGDRSVALLGLRGGPNQGEYRVHDEVIEPHEFESIYPGYKIKWVRRNQDPMEDPLSHYRWVARLDWTQSESS